jgi:hypothetical protein
MAETDALIERFGEGIRRFLSRAGKAQHSSGIFDLRRRTLMGCYAYFDHLPWALRVLGEHTTPEAIGRHGRGLCGQPFGAQIHGLLWGYLVGRENELALGRPGGDSADLVVVVDWWQRMMRAYRGDEVHLLPHEDADRQPAAPASLVRRVLAEHGRDPAEIEDQAQVTAGLQLYNYVLRGEQRGTTNFHGPYPAREPGRVLLVEEFTRLAGDELPWSADPPVMPLDTVCAILELDDVELRFDLFQGMAAEPPDYRSRLRRVALLTCDDGPPRELSAEERRQILEAAKSERPRLFRQALEWDADFKIEYGAFHYLDFLFPFLDAAKVGQDVKDEARTRFAETRRRRLREIADTEPVPVFTRLFADSPRLFTPLKARTGVAHG